MRSIAVPLLVSLSVFTGRLVAQGEEEHLPFVDANKAFAQAAKEGKRVLVYQDWPG